MRRLLLLGLSWALLFMTAGSAWTVSAQENATLTVTGQIVPGTANGEPLVFPMDVQLLITQQGAFIEEVKTTTAEDGTFNFVNVTRYPEDYKYLVVTQYAGLPQISEPISADELDVIELPVYDTSTSVNAGQIRIIDGTMIINFDKVEALGLEIILDLNILNVSDHIVFGSESSYTLELPVGAYQIASIAQGSANFDGRFIIDDSTAIPVVSDTAPIFPAVPHNIRLVYFLPFQAQATIHQVFPTDITNLAIWVPTTAVQLQSEYYDRGLDTVTTNGIPYFVYEQIASINVDENGDANLIFELGGRPNTQNTNTKANDDDDANLTLVLILLAVMSIIAILGGLMWWMGRQNTTPLES